MDTLGAAYASAGRFAEAAEIIEKALKLVNSPDQAELKKILEGRLKLFKAGKAYTE